jgi:GH18 family chitinase
MNILSYDYHSAFEPAVNHHSPLYPLEEDSEYNFDAQLSIVSKKKVKQSLYTPWRRLGGEEV